MKNKLSKKQINALKHLIMFSRDCGEETKRACFALIDASEGLTNPVYFTGYTEDISDGVHALSSYFRTTHLDQIMIAMGIKFKFSHLGGHFTDSINSKFVVKRIKGKEHAHTIWLSSERYDQKAKPITQKEVDGIKLIDPLYPDICHGPLFSRKY